MSTCVRFDPGVFRPALLAAALLAAPGPASMEGATAFRAGVARVDITPKQPVWMSGYASRKHASEGVSTPLFAKALALEDSGEYRVVIVTTDLIGLPRAITDAVSARAQKEYGLDRSQLLFNSSHTHSGPVVRPNLNAMYDLPQPEQERLNAYARQLGEDLYTVIGAALGDLAPAVVLRGEGKAGFAMNRREPAPTGIKLGVNPGGPVDHAVPVVSIRAPGGKLRAVLFGYACHNTTLGGNHYHIDGDYAGYAQAELEKSLDGAAAMFILLCGGDQNPDPRGTVELAREHGAALAGAVRQALDGRLEPVNGRIRSAYHVTDLPFAPHTRETFEAELGDANPYKARRAKLMLEMYDRRAPLRQTSYPVQALRIGGGLTLLALGGEVVVDYALRAKRDYPKEKLIVAAYSNDVMCYIPSLRVLREGGYEVDQSMVYYGMPGPFTEEVEERVFDAIHRVLSRVGAKR